MSDTSPQGLLAIWANVDTDYTDQYIQWHNCEHIPERITIPGFRVGRRYRANTDERDFFMLYETDSADVLQSPAYLHSQNNPTPWTRESVSHFRDSIRTIYALVAEDGIQPPLEAPYLFLTRANPPAISDGVEDTIRWYQDEHLPRLTEVSGVYRGRLYQADTHISAIMTTERQVHSGSPGSQTFLAIYDIADPNIPHSTAWHEATCGTKRSTQMIAALQHLDREQYWLDFVLPAPVLTME